MRRIEPRKRQKWQDVSPDAVYFFQVISREFDSFIAEYDKWNSPSPKAVNALTLVRPDSWNNFSINFTNTACSALGKLFTVIGLNLQPARLLGDFFSDKISLFGVIERFGKFFREVDNAKSLDSKEGTTFILRNLGMFALVTRSMLYNATTLICYGCSLESLYEKAPTNDWALFRLVGIDKSAINSEAIAKRIKQAEIERDRHFDQRLARAIAKRPSIKRRRQAKLAIMGIFLKYSTNLSYSQMAEFFNYYEIGQIDYVSLRKRITLLERTIQGEK